MKIFYFYFLRLSEAYQRRLKRQGEAVGQAVIPGDFKRSYKSRPYDSNILVSLTHCSQVYTLQSTRDVLTRSRLGKISAQPHTTLCIQLLDRENNDKNNTLPLRKQICFTIEQGCAEILPSLQNINNVIEGFQLLKILLTSMRVDHLHLPLITDPINCQSPAFELVPNQPCINSETGSAEEF